MIRTLVCALLLAMIPAGTALAQQRRELYPGQEPRVYQPKYLKGERAESVTAFIKQVVSSVMIYMDPRLNLIVLKGNIPADLEKAEEILKRFDVPPPPPPEPEHQTELTAYLVRAYADPGRVEGSVPPELAPVVKEMKGALTYAGFALVDTVTANVAHGVRLEDVLPAGAGSVSFVSIPRFYTLSIERPDWSEDGKTVTIGEFHFGISVPVSTTGGVIYKDAGITTPLKIREGQKVILGKVKLGQSDRDDLFIVVSTKTK